MSRSGRWTLILLGILILCPFVYILRLGDLRDHITCFFVAYGIIFIFYISAVLLVMRAGGAGRWIVVLVVAFGVLFRIALLLASPVLSDDILRYVWDGRVDLSGANPFSVPPDDPSLKSLRDEYFEGLKYKNNVTIYPPAAQGVFLLGAAMRPTPLAQKVLFTLFDIGVIFLVIMLLGARGKDPALSILYAWNPLVIMEFAHSGHMDSLGIFFLMLAVLLFTLRKKAPGFVALAFSFLSKYISVILLPFFICKKKYVLWIIPFFLVVIAGYLPFIGASMKLFKSMETYVLHWEFNSLLYTALVGTHADPRLIRFFLLALLMVLSFVLGYRDKDFLRYSYLVMGCTIFLSPTVYPWYVCWIVPFLCFFPNAAWILFTCLVVASYSVLPLYKATGIWNLQEKVLLLEYIPFYSLLMLSVGGMRSRLNEKGWIKCKNKQK